MNGPQIRQARQTGTVARVTLDAVHAAALEEAVGIDRARTAAGEHEWLRAGVRHEFCPALDRCLTGWPAFVLVTVLDDGIRIRRPIAPTEGAA